MPPDDRTPRDAHCPRCGYDLRGTAATWDDSCPLEGVCNECGLDFDWADLLNPLHRPPEWLIEYAPIRQIVAAAVSTSWITFAPLRFWKRMRMVYEPRWRRLAAYLAALAVVGYVIFAIAVGFQAVAMRSHAMSIFPGTPGVDVHATASARVVFLQAALRPWSARSPGKVSFNSSASGLSYSFGTALSAPHVVLRWFGPQYVFTLTYLVAAPLVFAILPISRRRARVRWRHIARIGAYSAGLIVPGYLLYFYCRISFVFGISSGTSLWLSPKSASVLIHIALLGTWLLYVVWWSAATHCYLRMRHGVGVGLVVCLFGVLVAAIVTNLIFPEYVNDQLMGWIR